jgi:putative peptidoglycan lipid II flippase
LAPDHTTAEPGVKSSSALARSAASAGIATMTSRLLGLAREAVLAHQFGAGAAMDAYNVAFRIPNLVRDLFAEGAMSAAFVPTFTKYLTTSGKEPAWRLGNHVVNALLIVTGLLVLLGIVFAEPLVGAFTAERFSQDPGQISLTVQLARIMLPALTCIAIAAAFMGMLNSLHHYFIPALSPAMFNVVTIICVIALVPIMPALGLEPIVAIAIGTLLGGVAQLALQWPTLRREGFVYRPRIDWRDPGLRRILVLMGPGTAGLAATQVNVFVNTLLATGAGESAVSWLNYAFRLMYLPIGLFGVSVATATLPTVARQHTLEDQQSVRSTIANGLSLMLMLNVPATVGLVVLAVPIIQAIYERGAFTSVDTLATAAALQFYAIGLLAYSVVRIVSPVFYALGRNRTPVIVSMVTVLVNAGLNVVLVREMGYRGLALGTSIAALFNAVTLLILLRRHLGGLHEGQIVGSLARISLASVAMGFAAYAVSAVLETQLPGGSLALQIVRLAATIGISVVVLGVASWLLRIREFRDGVALVTRRVGRRPR